MALGRLGSVGPHLLIGFCVRWASSHRGALVLVVLLLAVSGCASGDHGADELDNISFTSELPSSAGPATTTSTTSSTSTTLPTVQRGAVTYECEEVAAGRWLCDARLDETVLYCEGHAGPDDCSPYWYPSELNDVRIVNWRGDLYACQLHADGCVAYQRGGPPPPILRPTAWCSDRVCTAYDPELWTEVEVDGLPMLCRRALGVADGHDCYLWKGGPPPTGVPYTYCSGLLEVVRCSKLWYPSVLDSYLLLERPGGIVPCQPASEGPSHYDCGGTYFGGSPPYVVRVEERCSKKDGAIFCDPRWYPGAMSIPGAELYFVSVGGGEYVCVETLPKIGLAEDNCYRWSGGDPRIDVGPGSVPDLVCGPSACRPWSFPRP